MDIVLCDLNGLPRENCMAETFIVGYVGIIGKLICFTSFEFGTSLESVSRGYQIGYQIPPGTFRMYSMLSDKFPGEYRQTTCWKWCIDQLFRQMIAIC
jgi:hypothetical protein